MHNTVKDTNDILKSLDWEGFEFPLILNNLELERESYSFENETSIEIWRDIDFKLIGKIMGFVSHPDNLKHKNEESLKKGTFVKGISISGKTKQSNYLLRGCLIDKPSYRPQKIGNPIPFEAELIFDSIVRTSEIELEVKTIIDWHICSSRLFLFPRTTNRYSNIKPHKFRYGIDNSPEIDKDNLIGYRGVSRDFFILQVDKLVIIIQKIGSEYLPDWAGGIAIEYRGDISKIPTPTIREKVADFISFIFGFQILNIGSTHYDKNQEIVGSFAKSPWGNPLTICEMSPMPPFHFNTNKIEINLSKLLSKYFEVSDKYELNGVLWKLWIGRVQPIGTNLPIYSSGIETLGDKYLKENKIIKKDSKTEKKKYRELIQDEYDSLSIKLKDFQFGDFILNRLMNPKNYGVGEKMKLFFDNLGFNFTEDSIETKAMQARNSMAHTSIDDITDDKSIEFVRYTNAYITLYNRVVLRFLDYTGTYIDYYNFGHPSTKILENIKNTE